MKLEAVVQHVHEYDNLAVGGPGCRSAICSSSQPATYVRGMLWDLEVVAAAAFARTLCTAVTWLTVKAEQCHQHAAAAVRVLRAE